VSKFFNRATDWIVDRPIWTCLLLLVISSLAILGYARPRIFQDLISPLESTTTRVESDPKVADSLPEVDAFDLNSHAILVVESDSIFTAAGTQALRHIVKTLEEAQFIDDVIWIDEIPMLNIFGLPEPLLPHESASPTRFEAAKDKALEHPFIRGQLLSGDAKTTLLLVNFDLLFVESDEDCIRGLREIAESAAENFPDVEMDFLVTGNLPIFVTAMQSHEANQFFYQMVGYGMIAFMAIILFRGIVAVLVVALAPAMGVFWTLGCIRFFEFQDNPFNDVVLPVLVSLVGLTDGVHLMVQIRKLRSSGLPPKEASRNGIHQVGLACALTSLTTAIGFGSLSLAHHELVREFGYCCVMGVVLTFIAVVTTIPLACSTWLGKFVHVGQSKSLIDKNLDRIGGVVEYVLPRTRLISTLAILSTAVFILISFTLRPDERRSSILPTRSEPAIALKKMDTAMGGLERANVDLRWDDSIAKDDPQVIEVIGRVDELLGPEPLIGYPLSIRDLVESLPGDGPVEERMSMLELLPPELKRAFYTPERRTASVNFRVQDLGISQYNDVFARIEDGLAKIEQEYPEFELSLSGEAIWRWENLFQIVVDLAASLGTASLTIFGVLALVYRSLRIGLISIIPNLFPLAAAGAYLVFTGQALEIVTVCAFTVCLGIAVDDTIHFLTRYQEERQVTQDERVAIQKAFTGVGTALILTTIILVSGFCTVLFSDSRDHFIFASMGIITLSAALFADLVFLPAMLARFAVRPDRSVNRR
jgi:predicted RND superfamily exporter protein